MSPLSGRTPRCAPTGDPSTYNKLIWLSLRRIFNGFRHFPDTDGKIRAVQFTPPATGAALGFINHRGAFGIQAQALPGAEGGADAAGFAPVPEYVDLIFRVGLVGRLVPRENRIRGRDLTQIFL